MSEQKDNTTESNEPSPKEPAPQRGSYYYDDSTGYEVYDPSQEDDDGDEADERGATGEE
jgi:hypothetical protein